MSGRAMGRTGTMKNRLLIFDTTLRDGEQSPGASMTGEEKMRIAKGLEKMRVDVIEAGFPAASPGDFEAVKAVAISSAPARRSSRPDRGVFIPSSPLHRSICKKNCA